MQTNEEDKEIKHIIIFKNLTSGFMNLDYINYLTNIFSSNKKYKERISFILDNDASLGQNQTIMQMYNFLLGFEIFEAAHNNGMILKYKELNGIEIKKKINGKKQELNNYIKEKYGNKKIKIHIVNKNIYLNILLIVKEMI